MKIQSRHFTITRTPTGRRTIRWCHNNKAIKTVRTQKQAEQFVDFLVGYYSTQNMVLMQVSPNHYIVEKGVS